MTNSFKECVRYPLLEALLAQKGLQLQGIYSVRSTATIFAVSVRTIQEWVRDAKVVARDLPGRGRFLSEDLEAFLQSSVRRREKTGDEADSSDENARGHSRVPASRLKRQLYAK
jgi:hypothetical protein